MATETLDSTDHVVIVGGGLAGLSAAEALSRAIQNQGQRRIKITLIEARRCTGGRAGSFQDASSGESIDYCQHVAMGCCTNLIQMMDRCGLLGHWKRMAELNFHHPHHPPSRFAPSRWLPAPLHLASSIGGLNYLSRKQKREVRRGLWRLMRTPSSKLLDQTAMKWLQGIGQSDATIQAFWDVILVSALGESTEVVSMHAARKVLVDGFAAAHGASDVLVPTLPLSILFGEMFPRLLASLNVDVRSGTTVKRIEAFGSPSAKLHLAGGVVIEADHVVAAVPWFRLPDLLSRKQESEDTQDDEMVFHLHDLKSMQASPISGIHLWLDRPLMTADHAVMVGTMSQWVFRRPIDLDMQRNGEKYSDQFVSTGSGDLGSTGEGHYHQVVISASRSLDKDAILETVLRELRSEFSEAADFKLLRHRVVTDPHSVFSVSPSTQRIRRGLRPALPWLHLAGDWTDTGWPATMESAVISGRMAASAVLDQLPLSDQSANQAANQPTVAICPGLRWGKLSRLLIRR